VPFTGETQGPKDLFYLGREGLPCEANPTPPQYKAYDAAKTSELARIWALEVATTKEALPDIINVTLEYLVKERYELPAFSVLERICQAARADVNTRYYDQLCGFLGTEVASALTIFSALAQGLMVLAGAP